MWEQTQLLSEHRETGGLCTPSFTESPRCVSLMLLSETFLPAPSGHPGDALDSHSPVFLTAVVPSLLWTIKLPPGKFGRG